MNTGLAIRSVVTLFATACVIYIVFLVEPGRFPFETQTVDNHTRVIEPRDDRPLAPALRSGDRIDLRDQDLRTRAALFAEPLPGKSFTLRVRRDGTLVAATVTTISFPRAGLGGLHHAMLLLTLVLALTTLWWGRDWTAWGLTLFAGATILNFFLYLLPLPPVSGFVAVLLNQTVVVPLLVVGLYITALALAGPAIGGRRRRGFHGIFGLVLAVCITTLIAQAVGYVVFGNALLSGTTGLLFAITLSMPLIVLLVALPRADAARRLRLRWILLSLTLFIGAVAWNNLGEFNDALRTDGIIRQAVWWSALLCGLAGLLYAVLQKRVVAMSFAINRALVYGLVVACIVGVFGALTVVMENTAIGTDAGLALTIGVSLAIGFVLEALRDRINVVVERVFFRQRYEAEFALRRFARECAYIENADRLLDEAQNELHRHVRPRATAFYEASENGYVRVRQLGEPGWPERIDIDDRAFVSMRANREPVALRDVESALGGEGYAFPMAARGSLSGALVCGARTGEYTREERRLIAELAQQVGAAMHALRARENEVLVKALARGDIDPGTARGRARATLAGGLSAV